MRTDACVLVLWEVEEGGPGFLDRLQPETLKPKKANRTKRANKQTKPFKSALFVYFLSQYF